VSEDLTQYTMSAVSLLSILVPYSLYFQDASFDILVHTA